eukprot:COSAG01_NODE_4738_length_4782_cov_14.714072_5_plen_343_part_00
MAHRLALLLLLPPGAAGHGSLTLPASRASQGAAIVPTAGRGGSSGVGCVSGACEWFSVGCNGGCDVCTAGQGPNGGGNGYVTPYSMNCTVKGVEVGPGMDVTIPGADTLPHALRTWNVDNKSRAGDWTKFMPWRAPGSAAAADPCGVSSGHVGPHSGRQGPGTPGVPGSSLPALQHNRTVWKAASVAEVSWALVRELLCSFVRPLYMQRLFLSRDIESATALRQHVNHGGGYQYRLCPKGQPLNEECFRSHPLRFADKTTTVRYHDGSRGDFEIPAMDVSVGTVPAGSSWRRNPIPACNCDQGMDDGHGGCGGESERLVVESPWSQLTSECQRFGHPPRLDK